MVNPLARTAPTLEEQAKKLGEKLKKVTSEHQSLQQSEAKQRISRPSEQLWRLGEEITAIKAELFAISRQMEQAKYVAKVQRINDLVAEAGVSDWRAAPAVIELKAKVTEAEGAVVTLARCIQQTEVRLRVAVEIRERMLYERSQERGSVGEMLDAKMACVSIQQEIDQLYTELAEAETARRAKFAEYQQISEIGMTASYDSLRVAFRESVAKMAVALQEASKANERVSAVYETARQLFDSESREIDFKRFRPNGGLRHVTWGDLIHNTNNPSQSRLDRWITECQEAGWL